MPNFISCLNDQSLNNLKNTALQLNEEDAKSMGVSQADIELSRVIAFHPQDVRAFRLFTLEYNYLFILRCPKKGSQAFMGILPAKIAAIKTKTNDFGIVPKAIGERERWYVSDYDLMCVYKIASNGAKAEKVFFSGVDSNNPRSHLTPKATDIMVSINRKLINKMQHGAQDDFKSKSNRGVKMTEDSYVAVMLGNMQFLGDGHATHAFYRQHQLDWPYDDAGLYQFRME